MSDYLSDRESAAQQFKASEVVFEGEVVAVRDLTPETDEKDLQKKLEFKALNELTEFEFRVLRAYKGVEGSTIRLYSHMEHTTCGFGVSTGNKLFVYGFKFDGRLQVYAGTRTRRLEYAGPDIRYARGEAAVSEDLIVRPNPGESQFHLDRASASRSSTLCGAVHRQDGQKVNEGLLIVWDVDENGQRKDSRAATERIAGDGTYAVHQLQPGDYIVTAEDLQKSTVFRLIGVAGIASAQNGSTSCNVDLTLEERSVGTVSVRVNAPKSLHNQVFISLRDTETDKPALFPFPYASTAQVGVDGIASFNRVPYGRYVVSVKLAGEEIARPFWTHDDLNVDLEVPQVAVSIQIEESAPK